MFDHILGQLHQAEPTRIVIRVGSGSGALAYQVHTPIGTASRLEEEDGLHKVYTLTVQREELPLLLGFATREEREICSLFLKVSGIGPKMALSLLSTEGPGHLLRAIVEEDLAFLRSVKGVGPKTARRLCLEMRERAEILLHALHPGPGIPKDSEDPFLRDAVQALASLGFTNKEAEQRVRAAREDHPEAGLEDLVKAALRG